MKTFLRVALLVLGVSLFGITANASSTLTVAVAVAQIICGGASTGSINVFPGGGTGPYTYQWSNDSTTQNLNNLSAGSYSVTITDANGNTGTATITVTSPAPVTISKTITNEPCGGYAVGAIDLSISGGTPGYTFNWSNGDTSQNLSNLTAAVYYVTVTDAHGCATIDSANVTQPPGVVINSSISNASCEQPNGSIDITAQFGTPGYTYQWNDGSTSQNRTGLNAGNYIITVTDTIGCTASASENIGEAPSGISINYTAAQPACFGDTNGSITINSVVGSTGPYTFLWSDGSTAQNRINLGAGTYIVTATSSLGCGVADTIILSQPAAISVSLTEVPLTCFGAGNGAINTTAINGTSPYTYDWGAGITTQNRIGLSIGSYTITVTDFEGCTMTATTTVTEPAQMVVTAIPTGVTCTGGNTGSIAVSASGGTLNYSYWWGAGISSQNRSNLNAGTYTVTVTDAHGCTAAASATVNGYTPMTIAATQTNAICYGTNSGSINLTVSNGNSPYHYAWSNSDTTQNIDSLAGGTYAVTITDSSSCTVSKSYTITQPPFAITPNVAIANVNCNGENDGSISTNPTDGVSPYTYNWGGGITTQNRTGLAPGAYSVTITDHNGCSVTAAASITQPPVVALVLTDTNVSCFNGHNGAIGATPSGGFAPYTYIWTGGSSSEYISALTAGNYSVTVTDNHGCSVSGTTTLSQPPNTVLSTSVTNVSCNGASTGAVSLNVSGGTSPYTYNWGGGITSQNLNNIPAGNYTVIVTDSNGCTFTTSTSVTQATTINVTAAVTNIVCSGGNNGTINLTVTGGTPPYTFNWNDGNTNQNRSGLSAGTFTVTVTDHAGCTAVNSSTVTQTAGLTINASVTNVTCNGLANGAININPAGGAAPYNYNWGGGVTSQNRANLAPGTYTVNVTDQNGCTGANTSIITQPPVITASANTTAVSCNGGNNGTITLTVSGGSTPYTFNWGGGVTTQNRSNVAAGNYTVNITDSLGCTAVATGTINQPAAISVTPVAANVSCNGGTNGSISLNVNGGTGTYSYNWGGGITSSGRSNLASGSYSVTVTDANLCTATAGISITQPAAISIAMTPSNALCFGSSTGAITTVTSGGTGAYAYKWNNNSTSQNLTNVPAGSYTLAVTDGNSCTANNSANITAPSAINIALTPNNASCNGTATGSITVSTSGGTGTYTYVWSTNSTSKNLNNIGAGGYSLTVTDANSCTGTASATVGQASQIVSTGFVTNASCNGSASGGVVLTVNGGAGGFIYHWSNNTTNQNLSSADAGTYTVTITDANSCTAFNSFTITQPASMVVTTSGTNVTCFGGSNASITASVSGGAGGYTYNWSTASNNPGITNLVAGNYQVTVKDADNCSITASASVSQPAAITYSSNVTGVSCNGGSNGAISLGVSGGTAPYHFAWSNNGSTNPLNGLAPNTYSVTVTDANACTTTATAAVTQPAAIVISANHTDFACNNDGGTISLAVSGGTGAYTYNWGGGINTANRTNLNAGIYIVTVTDANACTAVSSITVNQLPQMNTTFNIQNVTCYNLNNGAINTTLTGGTPPYKFLWNNGDQTANISKLSAAVYELQVTDSNLCTITASATVSQPDSIGISANVIPVGCNGGNNGSATVIVTGGTPGFTYLWSNQETGATISNLVAGTYAVTVTDHSNCTSSLSAIIVNQPGIISVSANATPAGCSGNSSGTVDLSVSGGNLPYQYNWSNSRNTQNISGLAAGIYSVTVTDSKNCSANTSATVTASNPIIVTASVKNAACTGVDNGSVDVAVSGGTPSFIYAWNNGANTNSIGNAAPGNYSVTVTDGGGCSASANAVIGTEYDLTVNITGSAQINEGQGSTLTAVTNVDHNNVYSWSPQEFVTCSTCASTQANPVQNSEFTVSVVDANGCTASSTININVNTQVNIFIPNAFSPNNDGNNDYFQIFGDLGSIQYLDMAIFDRWGEKVFESQEPQFKWDGTYKGEPAPMAVYVYTMTVVFADGSHRDYKGSVTLVK